MNPILDPLVSLGLLRDPDITERQDSQWQLANTCLGAAGERLAAGDEQQAIAFALTGLLALQLSAR